MMVNTRILSFPGRNLRLSYVSHTGSHVEETTTDDRRRGPLVSETNEEA